VFGLKKLTILTTGVIGFFQVFGLKNKLFRLIVFFSILVKKKPHLLDHRADRGFFHGEMGSQSTHEISISPVSPALIFFHGEMGPQNTHEISMFLEWKIFMGKLASKTPMKFSSPKKS
jgi:hypothetical protein